MKLAGIFAFLPLLVTKITIFQTVKHSTIPTNSLLTSSNLDFRYENFSS
jgi:hypothetical protein